MLGVFSDTASSAALLNTQLFTPYGTQLVSNGNTFNQYTTKGFTGQYSDAVSGLDYYVSRYYDPVAGVFLSADKATGNAQGLNPYGYVGNNPETFNDPTGKYLAPPGGGNGNPTPRPCNPLTENCGGTGEPNNGNSTNTMTGCTTLGNPPPGPAYPILPNSPQWHQLGNILAYGYLRGEYFLFASIDEAFRTHTFAWEVDGKEITLDQVIAYYLALIAQAYRKENPFTTNNVGIGFYYVTNANGDVYHNIQGPVFGTNANAANYGDNHSERLLAADMYNNVLRQLNGQGLLGPGMTLHYITFTQVSPCPTCSGRIPSWETQLKQKVESTRASFQFSVYTLTKGGDPRYIPVTSIDQVIQYYPPLETP